MRRRRGEGTRDGLLDMQSRCGRHGQRGTVGGDEQLDLGTAEDDPLGAGDRRDGSSRRGRPVGTPPGSRPGTASHRNLEELQAAVTTLNDVLMEFLHPRVTRPSARAGGDDAELSEPTSTMPVAGEPPEEAACRAA